jgi:hypothetical protein
VHDRDAQEAAGAWRRDPSLPLPATAASATRPLPIEAGAALSETTSHAPFVVRGRDAVVEGWLDEPSLHVRCDGIHAAAGLRIRGATVRAARVTSLGVVRTLRLGDHDVVERIFVPATGSAAVVEWCDCARPDVPGEIDLALDWAIPGPDGPATARSSTGGRWHAAGPTLLAESEGAAVAFVLSNARDLSAVSWEDGSLRCAAAVAPSDGPIRLLMAGSSAGVAEASAAVERIADAEILARARAARVRRAARERLAVCTGDADIDRAVEWAGVRVAEDADRLAATARPDGDAGAGRAAVVALASLALGEKAPAERLLASWGDDAGITARAAALILLVAAWHGRWTGDAAAFADHLPTVRRAAEVLGGHRGRMEPLGAAALAEIARAAEAASPAFAAEARGFLTGMPAVRGSGGTATSLATLGVASAPGTPAAPTEPDASSALFSVLFGEPAGDSPSAAAAWRAMLAGPAAGLARWRDVLLSGMEHCNALWDHDLDPAVLLLAWVHAGLGAAPDAARHRLLLRPYAARVWKSWSVSELRVADARIGVSVDRDDEQLVARIDQSAGAFPLTLILELVLPETTITDVVVDGRPASLDVRRWGEGLIVPVQMVLDDRREVAITLRDARRSDKKAAPDERGRQ